MEMISVLTNRVPTSAVRGAGRPQAIFAMERLLDRAAQSLGIDRAEIRRRNFIQPEQMPYKVGLIYRDGKPVTYDSGDYPGSQDMALKHIDYESFKIEQAKALARALGLGEKMWRQPINQLSVGQQQRVAAVRALMGAPELVIADEPTSALDDARQLEFLDLLLQTAEKQNTSVIMVSHNERLAHRFDQVFEMHAGGRS